MSLLDAFRGGAAVELPLVYTREAVVFPKSIAPLLAATKFSIAAVEEALGADKRVVTALLKGLGDEKGSEIEVHPIGTVARVIQQVRLPDGSLRLLVEGEARVKSGALSSGRTTWRPPLRPWGTKPRGPEGTAARRGTASSMPR